MNDFDPSAFENEMQSALGRLDGLVARQQARAAAPPASADGSVSFDVSGFTEPAETGAEADLLLLMGEAEAEERGETPKGGDVHFGIEDSFGGRWSEAKAEFDAFVEKINKDVFHFAVVESGSFARTEVDWSGDAVTVLAEGASAREIRQHAETLRRDLMQRNLRLRMFTTVATAAGKITVLLTTPGAALLALPMAYKFVSQLSDQWKTYQSLNS